METSKKPYVIDIDKPLNHNDVYSFLKEKNAHSKNVAELYNRVSGKEISLPYRLTKPILLAKVIYPLKEQGLEKEFKTLLKEHPTLPKYEKKELSIDENNNKIKELAGKIKFEPDYKYLLDSQTRQQAELYLETNPNIPKIKLSSQEHLNIAELWQKEMNSPITKAGMSKGMTADEISEKVANHYSLHEYLSQENKLEIANYKYNSLLQKEVKINKAIIDNKYSNNDSYDDEIFRNKELKKISSDLNIPFNELKNQFNKDAVLIVNTNQTDFKIDTLLENSSKKEVFNDLNQNGIDDRIDLDRNKNGIDDKFEKNLYEKDLKDFGIDINSPKNKELKEDLLNGNKSDLNTLTIQKDGDKFEIDAKLSLRENEQGQKELRVHLYNRTVKNDINLSEKELNQLKRGEIIEKKIDGKTQLVQLDKDINELMKINKKDLQIPDKINNIKLTEEQKSDLKKGKSIKVGDKNAKRSVKLDFGKSNKISIKKEKSISQKTGIKQSL
ncbi:MAG: DUF3945 domain-containing protein [Flavobacteriaceae bacterium]|nr:DUF3945 domain-containing protein [Flavobacteriaceae bacterium]